MSERAAVALAVATAVGAHVGAGPDPLVGIALALVALAARRPWLLCLAAALLAAGLADRAVAGLDPVAAGPFRGWATLVDDPVPLAGGGVAVVLDVGGRRVEASAHAPPAWAVEDLLAGERVEVDGTTRPLERTSGWQRQRRITGRLTIRQVGATSPGPPAARAANALRRAIDDGAAGLPAGSRSLLTGVVLGDDRRQPPELADDFRAAGLSHLLAVSGQNVAFVLALARPLLAWLPGRARLAGTLAVLGAFSLVVRFEPSVLRAGAMAAIAAVASVAGRPAEGVRILALAVAALLLVDPLLVRSLGFGLSTGASAGILVLAPRIGSGLPGPRPLAEATAVTLAAQAGALPLLLGAFGQVPVATLPANLLAVPAAGPLMTWGLTGGAAAGLVDGWPRAALHVPTRLLTGWLEVVAGGCARLPLGSLDLTRSFLVAAAVVLVVRGRRLLAGLVAAVALAAAAVAVPVPPAHSMPAPGVELWRAGATVVVLGSGARPRDVLEGLRSAGARCVDAIVVVDPGPAGQRAAAALARRCRGVPVLAPVGEAWPGWIPLGPGAIARFGDLRVGVDAAGQVRVGSGGHGSPGHAAAPRAPPLRHHPPGRGDGDPEPDAGLVLRQGHLLRLR